MWSSEQYKCVFFPGEGEWRVIISDVGQNRVEELDVLVSGANYGWSAFEGTDCFKPAQCDEVGKYIDPQRLQPIG